MAEVAIRSLAGEIPILVRARVGLERTLITSIGHAGEPVGAEATVRGFDASRDLLYRIPNKRKLNSHELGWELDLHVPPSLSSQTLEHWYASETDGWILVQPDAASESLVTTLQALTAIFSTLEPGELLLNCDQGTLLLLGKPDGVLDCRYAAIDLESYADLDLATKDRMLPIPADARVVVTGSYATPEVVSRIGEGTRRTFRLISGAHLQRMMEFSDHILEEILGSEAECALAFGAAVHFGERENLLVSR